MMQIFYWVLNMAIVGSLVGLVLLLLRRIKKLPRNFIYSLYSIVLLRLLCPFGFVNGFSFLHILPEGAVKNVTPFMGKGIIKGENLGFSNFVQQAEVYQPFQLKESSWTKAYEVGAIIWIIVSVLLLIIIGLMYRLAMRELNNGSWVKDNIYQSNNVNAPMVVGIIKPRIYIPHTLSDQGMDFTYIIAHESTHIRKHDNLWRGIAIMICCIYWFNPLIWLLMKSFFEDMELACDETTLRSYTLEERKHYASTLLSFSYKDKMMYATAFSSGNIKLRIKYVLNYKEVTLLSVISFTLLFVFIALSFLSN